MSIAVASNQFIQTSSTPAFQDWSSLTPYPFVYQIANPGTLLPVVLPVRIRDVIGTPQGFGYSQFRLLAQKFYFGQNSGIDWCKINASGFTNPLSGAVQNRDITANGTIVNLTTTLENMPLMNPGNYECRVQFTMQARHNLGSWIDISVYVQKFTLAVYETEQVTWSPASFSMNLFQGVNSPVQEINMSGPLWTLLSPGNFILESDDVDVIITPSTSFGGAPMFIASGSGNRIVKIKPGTFFNSQEALANSPFNRVIGVYAGMGNYLANLPFVLNVLEQQPFYVEPTSLYFEGVKGLEEPEEQTVLVAAMEAYFIEAPFWLNVIAENEVETGNFSQLRVKPIHSNNLSGGTYQGNIILTSDDETLEIPVEFLLNDFVTIPYERDENNFTLDPVFLQFFTQLENTYFEMNIQIEAFDYAFQSGQSKTVTIVNKIPLFNKTQKMHLGEIVEKVLYQITQADTSMSAMYNAAKVNISIQEREYPSNELLRDGTLEEILFLSGLTPKNKNANVAILELSNQVKRVYMSSFDFINLMLPGSNDYALVLSKAETELQVIPLVPLTATHREKINFSELDIIPGDVVDAKIVNNDGETLVSKKYLIFPEEEYSTMILWEDEYRLIQSFHFSGKHTVKNDYTANQFKTYQDFVEVVRKLSSTKDLKLSINTGFITKQDIPYIDSIVSAKKAWIYISEDEKIEIIPNTKSLIYDDVDREIISFELEFDINKKYNEENFTR